MRHPGIGIICLVRIYRSYVSKVSENEGNEVAAGVWAWADAPGYHHSLTDVFASIFRLFTVKQNSQ